jgi:hypothetical protein
MISQQQQEKVKLCRNSILINCPHVLKFKHEKKFVLELMKFSQGRNSDTYLSLIIDESNIPEGIIPISRPNFNKGLEKLRESINENSNSSQITKGIQVINRTKLICKKQFESYCSVLKVNPFPVDIQVATNYLNWLEEVFQKREEREERDVDM